MKEFILTLLPCLLSCPLSKDAICIYLLFFSWIRDQGKWSSEGGARFGFSFALVVIASGVFIIDLIIISIASRDPYKTKKVFIQERCTGCPMRNITLEIGVLFVNEHYFLGHPA